MVDDQLDHYLDATFVGRVKKRLEIGQSAVRGVDVGVVGDIVAVVAQGRRKERKQPETCDAEFLQVIQLRQEAWKVADAVVVRVGKGAHVNLIDDRVLVPQRIERAGDLFHVPRTPLKNIWFAGL